MGKSEGPHTLLGTPNFSVRPRPNTLNALESREEWKYIRKLLSLEFSKRQFEDDNTMDDIGPIRLKNDVGRPGRELIVTPHGGQKTNGNLYCG